MAASNVGSPAPSLYEITEMENVDLVGIIERIDEANYEMLLSQSSGLTAFRVADRARIEAYLNRAESLFTWIIGQPEVDSPQTHPILYPISYLSNKMDGPDGKAIIHDPENKGLRDCVRMMRVWMAEMSRSASRRMPNGISKPDQDRFTSHLDKIRKYLTDYIDATQPVDLPETNPSSALSGQGHA